MTKAITKSSRRSKSVEQPAPIALQAEPSSGSGHDPVQAVVQMASPDFPPRNSNPLLPVLWADALIVGIKSDETATLRFYAILSDVAVEVARIQTGRNQLKAMIDSIAKLLNHYPVRDPKTPTKRGQDTNG
jgi:hypothetical protein